MEKLFPIIVFLFCSFPASATPAYVQSVFCHASSASYSCPAITPSHSNTLIIIQTCYNPGSPPTPSGNSNTYTLKVNGASSITGFNIFVWEVDGPTASSTTVAFTGAGVSDNEGFVIEYSGLLSSNAYDQGGYAENAGSANASVSTSSTTTQANELVIGYMTSGSTSPSHGSGFTTQIGPTLGNWYELEEDELVSSTGTQTATFVQASDGWGAVVATFKYSSGGATPTMPPAVY